MIIDLILDRKDGVPYDAEKFYSDIMGYESEGMSPDRSISAALDGGTNEDVQKALCNYVLWSVNGDRYVAGVEPLTLEEILKTPVCQYINSVNWLEDDDEELTECSNKKINEGYLNMTSIPTINTGVADDWYLPEVEDDEFNCGIDCNVAPMVGAQGGQSLSTMAGGEELPAEEDTGLDYLLQMAGVDGTEATPEEVVATEVPEEEYVYQPVDDVFSIGFEDDFDNSLETPSFDMTDDDYDSITTIEEPEVPEVAPTTFDTYDNEIDAFDGIMDIPTEEPAEEPVPAVEEPVETPVEANPEDMVLEKKENDIMNLPFDKVMELPDDDPRLEQYLKQHFVEWNAANDNEKIEALKDKVIDGIAGDVASQDYTQLVASELDKELEQLLSKEEPVEANPEDMVLEKQPETDDTEAQQIKDYLVHNKEVLYGPASAKIEQYRKSLDGKSIEELRVEAEEVSPNWKKYIGKYKITESVKVNESENLFKGIRLPEDKEEIIAMGKALKQDLLLEDNADFVRLHKGKPTEYEDWYQLWLQSDGNLPEFFSVYKDSINRERLFRMLVELGAEWFDKMDKLEEFVRSTKKEDWLLDESVEKLNESTMLEVEGNELFTIYKDPETNIFRLYDKRDNDWVEESEDIAVLEKIMEDESEHLEVSSDTEAEELNDKISELSEYGIIYTGDLKELAEKLGKNPQELEDIAIELGYKVEGLLQESEFDSDFDKLAGIETIEDPIEEPAEERLQGTKVEPTELDLENDGVATVHVYNIEWDCDGANPKDLALPTEVDLTVAHDGSLDIADEIADQLSDDFGFCHYGFDFDVKSLQPDWDESTEDDIEDDVKEEVPAGQQILTEEGEELSDEDIAEIEDNETLEESVEAILPSDNKEWGFYGTCHNARNSKKATEHYWEIISKLLQERLQLSPLEVRVFLDSRDGRYLADDVINHGGWTDENLVKTFEEWFNKKWFNRFLKNKEFYLNESAEKIEAKNVDIEPEEVKVEETTEADLKHEIPENDMIKDNVDTGEEVKFDEPVEAENVEIETKEFEVKETTEAELKHEIKDNEPIKDSIETGEEIKVETPVEAENVDLEPEEKADKYVESVIYSVKMKDDKIVECKTEEEFNKLLSESVKDIKSVVII